MALEYMKGYCIYFHIGRSYVVIEGNAYKTVRWIEDTLIKRPNFALPGRTALIKSDRECDIIYVDVTEAPFERPKKSKEILL